MNQSAKEKIILESLSRLPIEISFTLSKILQEHKNKEWLIMFKAL